MAELKSHVAGLSVDIAEKVVRQELSNKDKQLALVESMLGEAKLKLINMAGVKSSNTLRKSSVKLSIRSKTAEKL